MALAPRPEVRNLKLSKIDHYLVDNVLLLRLSNLNNLVKKKTDGRAYWTLG
jgi:hypothetical protein